MLAEVSNRKPTPMEMMMIVSLAEYSAKLQNELGVKLLLINIYLIVYNNCFIYKRAPKRHVNNVYQFGSLTPICYTLSLIT